MSQNICNHCKRPGHSEAKCFSKIPCGKCARFGHATHLCRTVMNPRQEGRQDNQQDNRPDNRKDNRPDNRKDNRQDNRTDKPSVPSVPQKSINPFASLDDDDDTKEQVLPKKHIDNKKSIVNKKEVVYDDLFPSFVSSSKSDEIRPAVKAISYATIASHPPVEDDRDECCHKIYDFLITEDFEGTEASKITDLFFNDETLDDKTMRIICKNLRLSYPLIRSIVRPFIEERQLRALLEQQQLDELDKLDEIKNNDSEEEW